jgi:hypothetical protein
MDEERALVGTKGIEALMAQRMNALLVLTAGDPHEATMIAQEMLQGSLNPALEEGSRGAVSRLEAGSSTDKLIAGHLTGIIELGQAREAPLETNRCSRTTKVVFDTTTY